MRCGPTPLQSGAHPRHPGVVASCWDPAQGSAAPTPAVTGRVVERGPRGPPVPAALSAEQISPGPPTGRGLWVVRPSPLSLWHPCLPAWSGDPPRALIKAGMGFGAALAPGDQGGHLRGSWGWTEHLDQSLPSCCPPTDSWGPGGRPGGSWGGTEHLDQFLPSCWPRSRLLTPPSPAVGSILPNPCRRMNPPKPGWGVRGHRSLCPHSPCEVN